MGPNEVYTMFNLEGRNTGGCYALNADMLAQDIPPHWMLYVAVKDVDKTAQKVAPHGGSVVKSPFDVMDYGRMAIFQDLVGAYFAVWHAKKHHGVGIQGVPGTVCWADLITPEPRRAADFYHELFDWKFDHGKGDSGYLHIKSHGHHIGGIPPAEQFNQSVPPHWILYFQVPNSDAATDQAKAAGATVHVPPMTVEGVGRWSVVADPQGASFALFQPAH